MTQILCDVSLVMLAHNGVDQTRHCLKSLVAAQSLPRELILIDQASSDATPDLLPDLLRPLQDAGVMVKTWRHEENLGCSESRNRAWREATSTYTAFCDNDIVVCTSDWLNKLVAVLEYNSQIGIVGPKLIYPYCPHPIQCAGVDLNRKGRITFRGRGAPRLDTRYTNAEEMVLLISACWLMRSHFLEEIGGLDPLFHPVQYEDLDYCMRVREAGYSCWYTPDVEMYHFEGTTTASGGDEQYQKVIARNSLKFRHKWRDAIRIMPDKAAADWLAVTDMGMTPELCLDLIPPTE